MDRTANIVTVKGARRAEAIAKIEQILSEEAEKEETAAKEVKEETSTEETPGPDEKADEKAAEAADEKES